MSNQQTISSRGGISTEIKVNYTSSLWLHDNRTLHEGGNLRDIESINVNTLPFVTEANCTIFGILEGNETLQYESRNVHIMAVSRETALLSSPELNATISMLDAINGILQMEEDDENITATITGNVTSAPLWRLFLDYSQLVLTVSGLVANSFTVFCLAKNDQLFSKITRILLIHQSLVDAFSCACAVILFVAKPYSLTGVYGLDILICMLWYGQFIFWYSIFISIYNLVLLAVERYLAICHPLKRASFTKRYVFLLIAAFYFLGVICNIGAAFQTKLSHNGTCVNEYFLDSDVTDFFYLLFAFVITISYWVVPVFLFIFLYGTVAYTLHKRKNNAELGTSRVINQASRQLTRTSVVVTCIFTVAIGFDIWYYLIGKVGVVRYENNSPLQKISVWLSVFNSVVNPYVYMIMMPNYRRCVMDVFCARRFRGHVGRSVSRSTVISTSSA